MRAMMGMAAAMALGGAGIGLRRVSEYDVPDDPNHPLRGRAPTNGRERAIIREWDAAKRRDALYAAVETAK
jgi:hypothetical protein